MGSHFSLQPNPQLLEQLGVGTYQQRWPWFGGDLQTLRDTIRPVALPEDQAEPIRIAVPALASGAAAAGELLAFLDRPLPTPGGDPVPPQALVLALHGLGGSSRREGLRRLVLSLQRHGFAVLRLNLRGADPGRDLAGGTYAAACNSDLLPVIARARELCRQLAPSSSVLPLFGAGVSLGGTMLLNGCLASAKERAKAGLPSDQLVFDGLFCASSPLDLAACSASIERPRNRVYQRWLLQRLVKQTLADPFGVSPQEDRSLTHSPPRSIRSFDAAVTAPRWGFDSVEAYYSKASPLPFLLDDRRLLPPTLLLQALDDPWVPADGAERLLSVLAVQPAAQRDPVSVLLTERGGHNGFHAPGDSLESGCWSDRVASAWLTQLSAANAR
ncbi:alpha/beta fold hydrolase [Synechococcus sp. UW179A]|uniref:alpha/beta fold hydrolase n=1 Tax=Synechococcus sp. UW179A TaxID=2575510 RepID=UPI000E0EB4BB|nr:alpha/beta fold hydrolase [Synechococcus sp. UW179A]